MNSDKMSFLARRRYGLSSQKWLEIGLVVLMVAGLNLIEPLSKMFVRDVISQNVIDQRLSYYANEIVIQTLLCRRFEKDMLLHIDDDAMRDTYRARWDEALLALEGSIEGFYSAAEAGPDRAQADAWRGARATYQAAMLETLQAIEAGAITEADEANRVLTEAKRAIRGLTDTAMSVAHTKEGAAESSSSALRSALSGSARTLTLLALGACLIWIIFRR